MNSLRVCVPLVAAIFSIGLIPSASAYTGDDPVLATGIASCTYTEIEARIGPDKLVKYKVYGVCNGTTVSGETAFRDGKFQESFAFGGARIRTSGYCDRDPFATGTAIGCHDQQLQSSGAIVDQNLYKSPPLTLLASGAPARFQLALQNASRPNPPGVPVNFAASSQLGRVKAKWLAPDTSGDRPFIDFLLQARPLHAEGAGWVDLGRLAWHAAPDYQLNAKLPPTSAAVPSWDVRVCATTAFAATCTPALTPANSELVTEVARKDRAASVFEQNPPAAPSVKALGRVAGTGTAPAVSICDAARNARARNSPAAPGLEAQCVASGGSLAPPKVIDAAELDELALKGGPIAEADPLALALRDEQSGVPGLHGFDIGMAAAENQTAPGPGKQRIRDALPRDEQAGYDAAVAFSLERNRNSELAAKGAAIDAADPTVAEARDADPDVFFRLGFDIATGIFGDPALGALGNTATGPGSLKIRDALSAVAQRGFNAAVQFHLARHYR